MSHCSHLVKTLEGRNGVGAVDEGHFCKGGKKGWRLNEQEMINDQTKGRNADRRELYHVMLLYPLKISIERRDKTKSVGGLRPLIALFLHIQAI
jgi:hypothetical protein